MKRINIVLIIIVFNITLLQAYDWPIKESTTQHIITSVMGECRSKYQGTVIVDSINHFHHGVDNKIEEVEFGEITLDFNLQYNVISLIK